ncbi:MAG: DUF1553 domain-containing protein [Verrucomicrobia bacterium]|nr:DUF1553 domain-containing protein [Verrucomicrobiota bacterium]
MGIPLTWAGAQTTLRILPDSPTLSGPAARQMLILERLRGGRAAGQETNSVEWSSSDPTIVTLEGSVAIPRSNGKARITARHGGGDVSTEVTVSGLGEPFQWSFRNHVQPVLAKAGCSSGACHGAAGGQGGFRLSLRGYDDAGDHAAITRSALGRRIDAHDPGMSLLLLKPTGAVPHKGGERFTTNSVEYQILSEWIAAGAPGPKESDPRIQSLEIIPSEATLQPGDVHQFLVQARFSDGTSQDVTRWVKYSDADSTVTASDERGSVKVQGFGEGAVTAWYLSRLAIGRVIAPYTNELSDEMFSQATRRNFIDDLSLEKLKELKLPPSPRSSDSEFLRRAYLDVIGSLPSAEETREFLSNPSSGKRDDLIESLLARPEFVDYWSYKWSDLLLVNGEKQRTQAMWSYYNWIRSRVAANVPWDELVREIVTASGSTFVNGAANFYALHEDPPNMAETVTQAFLGMSINCAKCHNHPMEKWTNDEYFGFANLFARVRSKNGSMDGERIIFAAPFGDINQPLRGKPQPPKPLEGEALDMASREDRRHALAQWLTSPTNPYFTRSIVNRVWASYFGVGLVEEPDDLRVTNPASNEKLLSAAAGYLASQKFDLKQLMRSILQSETYQRTSETLPGNAQEARFYSRYYPKRLSAEVLLDAFSQVTAVPTDFQIDLRNANRGLGDRYPAGLRALQLPDTKVFSYFLKTFGRPDREKTCECERASEPSMAQALHLANGDTVNKKLAAPTSVAAKMTETRLSPQEIVEQAYLAALSRQPSDPEKAKMTRIIQEAKPEERRQAIEDVYWALLTSKEFLFNH